MLEFCHRGDFLFVAGVSKTLKAMWIKTRPSKSTSCYLAAATESRMEWVLDDPGFKSIARPLGGIACIAAGAGNLGGLQLAVREHGSGWAVHGLGRRVMNSAASGGYIELLKWARGEGCPWNELTCSRAVKGGHLEVIQWLRARGCPWDEWTCSSAAGAGHLGILRWAREQGCPWNEFTCSAAAIRGYLNVLQWAREEKCPWDEDVCSYAAAGGHLELLKWTRGAGCPWDEGTARSAAESGHLKVLQWAISQSCPWNRELCLRSAIDHGRTEVVTWLRDLPVH